MIKVDVRFLLGDDRNYKTVEIEEGLNISQLLNNMRYNADDYITAVNGVHKSGDYVLHEGDKVEVFPAIIGG